MTVSFSMAMAHDLPQICALWREAFGDDSADIERFFSLFPVGETVLLCKDGDRVLSMLSLIPTSISSENGIVPVGYIYAGATLPSARGNGYYRRLLTFANDVAKQRGMAGLLLRPANKALEDSYRRMGFSVSLPVFAAMPLLVSSAPVKPLSAADYQQTRRRVLTHHALSFVDWDARVFDFAASWCALLGDDCSCLLSGVDDDTKRVWEVLNVNAPPVALDDTAALLLPIYPEAFVSCSPMYFGYGLE